MSLSTSSLSCCCYHKGTYFQANHNVIRFVTMSIRVVVATTKVRIFKQITTQLVVGKLTRLLLLLPQRYVFSSKSQPIVIIYISAPELLLLPQRYVFSSKSQLVSLLSLFPLRCCCYHKGTYFQANHNTLLMSWDWHVVVVATTKVRIFKQITTGKGEKCAQRALLLLPQRYVFSSKSQLRLKYAFFLSVVVATTKVRIFKQITTKFKRFSEKLGCCCYHKGTYFQANHNKWGKRNRIFPVVVATTKVRIFKQITTFM